MGLTRIRADQISNIDYKQAVKVITLTNISNLANGAPLIVDGVTLSVGDRVLVTAQATGSQNGIYIVQSTGTGNNGAWIRASDANATGDLEAGTIVMVTDGSTYADTSWKLITDDPIVIGTSALTFLQNNNFIEQIVN
jgi:phage-related tail fiber protein